MTRYNSLDLMIYENEIYYKTIPEKEEIYKDCKRSLYISNILAFFHIRRSINLSKAKMLKSQIKELEKSLDDLNNRLVYLEEISNIRHILSRYPKINKSKKSLISSIDNLFYLDKKYGYNLMLVYKIQSFIEFIDTMYNKIISDKYINNNPDTVLKFCGYNAINSVVEDFNIQLKAIRNKLSD